MSKTPTKAKSEDRGEKNLNVFVGVCDGEYVFAERVFDHGGMKGATGHSLRIVTKADYDERTSDDGIRDHVEDIWREKVAHGDETCSLNEFVERVKNNGGDSAVSDDSWYEDHDTCIEHYNAQLRKKAAEEQGVPEDDAYVDPDEEAVQCEAGGSGRMFCKDGMHGKKWSEFEYLNPDPEAVQARKLIGQYETETVAQYRRRNAPKRAKKK